jgi:hypothetical protein
MQCFSLLNLMPLNYTLPVFVTVVILLAFFFHLDGQIALRVGYICNIVRVFLSYVCCGYKKNRADLDHSVTKFSAIVYSYVILVITI